MDDSNKLGEALQAYSLSDRHIKYCKESFATLRPSYHNEEHCYSTALTFHELAEQSDLNVETRRNGFVAALYHDARHLMASDDAVNIKSALDWIKQADFFEDSIDLKQVSRLIRATNNANEHFRNRAEVLMHDADVLQTVKGSIVENVLWQKRLAEELASNITAENSLRFVLDSVRAPETLAFLKRKLKDVRSTGDLL